MTIALQKMTDWYGLHIDEVPALRRLELGVGSSRFTLAHVIGRLRPAIHPYEG